MLQIKLGIKKEKRLMKHLEMEHPSVRGNIKVVNKIICNVPNFEKQAHEMTKINRFLKGGNK